MKIYLIGFMGCGKTTVGKRLAAYCGFLFVDTDKLFETKHNCSIERYMKQYGEDLFRMEEALILRDTVLLENTVVSVGGGTPCCQDNMQWILSNGIAVYIQMSASALHSRLVNSKTPRPLLSQPNQDLKSTVETLLSQREPVYNQAHITVSGLDFDMENLLKELNSQSLFIPQYTGLSSREESLSQ